MKKYAAMLLALALCALLTPALADPLPPELVAQHIEYPQDVADCLVYELPDGAQLAVTYGTWGSLDGYLREDDAWTVQFRLNGTAEQGRLMRLDGETPAFAVVSMTDDGAVLERWAWADGQLRRTGWACAGDWAGWADAEKQGTLTYISEAGTAEQVAYETEWHLELMDHASLPMAPDEARALLAISREHAPQYPGFTLVDYSVWNSGQLAQTQYVRIEDGCITFRTETLAAGQGVTETRDSMPVPVTQALSEAVAERGADAVFPADADGKPFALAPWLDRGRIPVSGEVLQSDAQACGLVLLTQEEGLRRLSFVTRDEAGAYAVQTSPPLPQDTYLDLFHAGEGEIQPELGELQAGYALDTSGVWRLSWLMGSGFTASAGFGRVSLFDGDDTSIIGSLPGDDLLRDGLTALPHNLADLRAAVDAQGWAVVANPDPSDRLYLRAEPSRSAKALGKFYNGTTLRVLERQGDWTRVSPDRDDAMTGWMMTKYLVFGERGAEVAQAFPVKQIREHLVGSRTFLDAWMTAQSGPALTGRETIIGLLDAEGKRPASFIILSEDGSVGYVPQAWFWDGNG